MGVFNLQIQIQYSKLECSFVVQLSQVLRVLAANMKL